MFLKKIFVVTFLFLTSCSNINTYYDKSKEVAVDALSYSKNKLDKANIYLGDKIDDLKKIKVKNSEDILGDIKELDGLSAGDYEQFNNVLQKTLENNPINKQSKWYNAESGNNGAIYPIKTYRNKDLKVCREYSQRLEISSTIYHGKGRACRNEDGSWKYIK